jgi:histone demethylase JARID1
MVVPPLGGGSSSLPTNARASPAIASTSNGVPKSKNGNVNGNGYHAVSTGNPTPISARKAAPLDMSTVERRGHPSTNREVTKRIRPHNLPEAPTYRPTEEDFKDPMKYIQSIAAEGRNYGIVKIIPPDGWNPDFAIDTQVRQN